MISVCMATYNGAKYLREQVDSILSQLTDDDELIVSDDGSIDATLDILKSYEDSRIKIIHHNKTIQKFPFGFTTSNFESALREASGDIIFLSDQDDVWVDEKVIKMVNMLENCVAVLSDCSFVDSELNVLIESKIKFEGVRIGVLRNLYKCGYLGSSMAFKRSLVKHVLPFPKNVPHDIWIGLVAGSVGKFKILNDVTLLYRRHDTNVSGANNKIFKNIKQDTSNVISRNNNSALYRLHYRLVVLIAFLKFKFISK